MPVQPHALHTKPPPVPEILESCVPLGYPFARRDSIRLEDLWHEPLIREGVGISTLLRMVAADEPRVAAVPFSPPCYLDLHIAWNQDGYLSRANRAFRDFLLERIDTYR